MYLYQIFKSKQTKSANFDNICIVGRITCIYIKRQHSVDVYSVSLDKMLTNAYKLDRWSKVKHPYWVILISQPWQQPNLDRQPHSISSTCALFLSFTTFSSFPFLNTSFHRIDCRFFFSMPQLFFHILQVHPSFSPIFLLSSLLLSVIPFS